MSGKNNKSDFLLKCTGFEWDEYNSNEIWIKHEVSSSECEQAFFNILLMISDGMEYSAVEKRHYALGSADGKRNLFIVFTIRNHEIRAIYARNMNRKERKEYEFHKKDTRV